MKPAKKTTDRSRFIKKYHEHEDWRSYKNALGRKEKGTGIYVLYKDDEVYYIGLSKRSLRSRLTGHAMRDSHKGKWNNFSYFQISKTRYIKDVESLLLRIVHPKGNKVKGTFKRKYNLARKKPNPSKQ